VRLPRASELTPSPVEWLWQWHLGRGALTLLAGDPNKGKSLIALDLCARLSRGRPWPDGTPSSGPANCLYLGGEDRDGGPVRARLEAAGADMNRVTVWPRGPNGPGRLRLPSGVKLLQEAITDNDLQLVVLDPVMSFLDPQTNLSNDLSVRSALEPVADRAEELNVAVLLHRHLNKKAGGAAIYRGAGSIAFTALCRSEWLAAADPGVPRGFVLAEVKNNHAPPQPSLSYTIQGGPDKVATLAWLGDSPWTSDALSGRSARDTLQERAKHFLLKFLANGPRTTRDIEAAGLPEGYSKSTLRLARVALKAAVHRRGWGATLRSYWVLPGQTPPSTPVADNDGIGVVIRDLEEEEKKFPPPSALDQEDD
jgi:hypothetical protein